MTTPEREAQHQALVQSPDAVLSAAVLGEVERLDGVGSGERAGEAVRLAGRAKDALAQAGLSSDVISDGELLAIAEEVSRYSPAPVLPVFDASNDGLAEGDVTRARLKQVAVARIASRVEYQNRADMIDLVNAAVFARLHHGMNTGHVDDDGNRLPSAGNPVHLAGVNAPAIAQAAITDYAILADITTGKALDILTAVIELTARLPHTFRRVVRGRLPAKQAVKLARDTVPLSLDAAGWSTAAAWSWPPTISSRIMTNTTNPNPWVARRSRRLRCSPLWWATGSPNC